MRSPTQHPTTVMAGLVPTIHAFRSVVAFTLSHDGPTGVPSPRRAWARVGDPRCL
jgi:hypothetical protein